MRSRGRVIAVAGVVGAILTAARETIVWWFGDAETVVDIYQGRGAFANAIGAFLGYRWTGPLIVVTCLVVYLAFESDQLRKWLHEWTADKFTVDPDLKWSQEQIWTDYRHYDNDGKPIKSGYRLDTVLCARFANSDTESHVVKGLRVTLFKRGLLGRLRSVANSYLAITDIKKGATRIDLNNGITVAAKGLSDYYMFQVFTRLPEGIDSLDKTHVARFFFDVMGRNEALYDMPIDIPRPHETFGWLDDHARELIEAQRNAAEAEARQAPDTTKPIATVTVACEGDAAYLSVKNDGALAMFGATIRVEGMITGFTGSEFARWTHSISTRISIPHGMTFKAKLAELEWNDVTCRWKLFGTSEFGIVDGHAHYSSCPVSTPIARAPNLIVFGHVFAEPDLANGPVPYRIVLSAFGCNDQNQA